MSQRVMVGKLAADSRRKSAYERLEMHLKNHSKAHIDLSEMEFSKHDKLQRMEFEHVGNIVAGKTDSKLKVEKEPEEQVV